MDITKDDLCRIQHTSFDTVFKNAVSNALRVVGNNPVLCLSGGIDSQAMLDIWKKSGVQFSVVTFDFDNKFNSDELQDALNYARSLDIPVQVIKLDVMRFLFQKLPEFSQKYKMLSPQFCVHAFFIEHIKSLGYTGVVLGGNGPILGDGSVKFQSTTAQLLDLEKFSTVSEFPVISSFLSFDKDLCVSLTIRTPVINKIPNIDHISLSYDTISKSLKTADIYTFADRYQSKIKSYTNLGLFVIPQEIKKTGFEQIKKYYNSLNNSDLAFDRDFRVPLLQKFPEMLVESCLDKDVEITILELSDQLSS